MLTTRRRFVQLGLTAAGLITFPIAYITEGTLQRTSSARIRATRWTDKGPSVQATVDVAQNRQYVSPVYRVPYAINAIGPFWTGTIQDYAVRYSVDGQSWSPWTKVTFHENHLGPPDPRGRRFGDIISAPDARYVQYRLTIPSGAQPPTASLELIDSAQGPSVKHTVPLVRAADAQPIPIISRAQWGCDESLGLDSHGQVIWPPDYRTIQKSIVHNTATANFEDNPAATVRSIYYYHSITRGWGDIGYNYLVDWRGNVYEGRKGGDKVVGGHAYSYSRHLSFNYGSLGIGNLGTFTTVNPSSDMLLALARLISWKARYVDPHGDTYFVAGFLPNLMGHRDAVNTPQDYETECPGDAMEALLPEIRGDVWVDMGKQTPIPRGQIVSATFPSYVAPGGKLPVKFVVKNVGTGVMVTEGPNSENPVFVYNQDDTFAKRQYAEIQGCWRVGVDYAGNSTGRDHPYRWGLPDALNPGDTATINGEIKLMGNGRWRFWAGLVQEGVGWVQDQVDASNVMVGQSLPPRVRFPLLRN